jgi:UDP-N-acetylglucosamine:LPS N-acetylglucosamine transferase
MLPMVKVDLVWFNAGGGHRAAAQALEQEILAQGRPWRVRKVNLTEVLDPTGLFKRVTGIEPEDIYNKRLASGFTLGLAQELKLLQALIRLAHPQLVQRLQRHWLATAPDMVVSLIPNFNRCLHDSLHLARPGVPFVTVMTDMADHPPNFWAEPGLRQHLVCGTAYAESQALAAGCAPQHVHRANGMVLRPEFHLAPRMSAEQRREQRIALGLDGDSPTGLVLFGGTGSRVMKRIAQRLPRTPLILMCGRNDALADELRALPAPAPRVVVGYTADVMRWMQLADFFIGKPGPGSLSEAVQMGLPVIVTQNAWTMPQERYNTRWVQQHGLGRVQRSFATVQQAVDQLTQHLDAYRQRVQGMHNRAVFEVPQILDGILQGRAAAQASAPESAQA